MVAVALILLGIVILFTVAVVVSNPAQVDLSIFGAHVPTQTPAVFFAGAGTMLVAIVALLLLRAGLRRSMARRKEVRALRKGAKAQGKGGTDGTSAVTVGGAKAPDAGGSTASASGAGRGGSGDAIAETPAADRTGPAGPTGRAATGRSSQAPPPEEAGSERAAGPAGQSGSANPSAGSGQTTAAERQAWLAEIDEITGGDDPKR